MFGECPTHQEQIWKGFYFQFYSDLKFLRKGYEIEIKTVLPDAAQINGALNAIKRNRGERIFANTIKMVLDQLGKGHFYENFQNGKSASHLAIEVI